MTRSVSTTATKTSTAEPVTLDLIISQCNVVADDDDALLQSYAKTARELLEDEAHITLVRKTLRHRLPAWPADSKTVALPGWPLVSIESVQAYVDGTPKTIATSDYTVQTDSRPGSIYAAGGWPTVDDRPDAIEINYLAGFDPCDKPAPSSAVSAILLLVAHWYKHREAVVAGTISKEIELGFQRLLNSLHEATYP